MTTRILILCGLLTLSGCGGDGDPEQLALTPPAEAPNEPAPNEPPATPPPSTTPPTPPKSPPPAPPTPPPAIPSAFPDGIWHGQTKHEGLSVTGVILPDGRTWFVTSVLGAPDWAGGVINGTMEAEGSTWIMTNTLLVFNYELPIRASVKASGTFLDEQRLLANFQLTYDPPSSAPSFHENDGLDLIYDTRSKQALSLTSIAGRYTGLFLPLEEVEIIISATGGVTGRAARGCTFDGTITAQGPVGLITLTFDGTPCRQDHATVRGVVTVDQSGRLVSTALSSDRNQVFIFIGRKGGA